MNMTKETNLPVEAIQPILEESTKALPSPSFPWDMNYFRSNSMLDYQIDFDMYVKKHNIAYIPTYDLANKDYDRTKLVSKSGVMYDKFYKELKRDQTKSEKEMYFIDTVEKQVTNEWIKWMKEMNTIPFTYYEEVDNFSNASKYLNDENLVKYLLKKPNIIKPVLDHLLGADSSITLDDLRINKVHSNKDDFRYTGLEALYETRKQKATRLFKYNIYYNKLLNDLQYHYEKSKTLVKEDTRAKEIHDKLEAFINCLKENKQKP